MFNQAELVDKDWSRDTDHDERLYFDATSTFAVESYVIRLIFAQRDTMLVKLSERQSN